MQTLHRPLQDQRQDILEGLRNQAWVKQLKASSSWLMHRQSEKIPAGHREYHVGQGLLYGSSKLEIDPVVFSNAEEKTLSVIYHLGQNLSNEKGKVHKGVLSLLLDEGLCYCGFPTLPNKRGVTASLEINFEKDVPLDSTIVLNARVVENKGRKCIIEGTLQSPPLPEGSWLSSIPGWIYKSKPTVYATAKCVLVEPRWFKYITWINVF